ncbi:MAG: DUF4271 domain-containing protein [Tidjanibacter sp.]|nr:DUF4271 domain-containing protein [Tidjanibacter sp.]
MSITEQHITPLSDTLPVASVGDLFGSQARLVAQPEEAAEMLLSLTDNIVVWVMVVALFAYYLFVMFAYGGHIGQMAKIAIGKNLGIRVADELSYLFMRAVRNSVAMGIIAWSLVAVGWMGAVGAAGVGGIDPLWLVPLFALVLLALGGAMRIVTIGICTLTRRKEVSEGLGVLSETLMGLASIIVTPVALLFVVNTGASVELFGTIALLVACVALFVYITKSLVFFIEQKISILLWFLYLCTVVLIPIGAVLTVMVRSSVI